MPGVAEIDNVAQQQQAGPIVRVQGVKRVRAADAAGPRAEYKTLHHHRPAKLFVARKQIQRMKLVKVVPALLGLGCHVDRSARKVNDRGGSDADFGGTTSPQLLRSTLGTGGPRLTCHNALDAAAASASKA